MTKTAASLLIAVFCSAAAADNTSEARAALVVAIKDGIATAELIQDYARDCLQQARLHGPHPVPEPCRVINVLESELDTNYESIQGLSDEYRMLLAGIDSDVERLRERYYVTRGAASQETGTTRRLLLLLLGREKQRLEEMEASEAAESNHEGGGD
jgi:hypothetical protein